MHVTRALVVAIFLASVTAGQSLNPQSDYSDSYRGRQLLWKTARFAEAAPSGGGTIDIQFGLARPHQYDPQADTVYSLVIYLHGAGARGSNLSSVLNRQTAREFAWYGQGGTEYAAFVLAPQVPSGQLWAGVPWEDGPYDQTAATYTDSMYLTDGLIAFLTDTTNDASLAATLGMEAGDIDTTRIYVVGDSMGAYGTWDIVGRHPGWFAAAIAASGSGPTNRLTEIVETPFWAIHGTVDTLVPNALPSAQDGDGAGSLGMLALIDPTFDNTTSTDMVKLDDYRRSDDNPTPADRLIYTEFPSNYGHATVAMQWTTLVPGVKEWLFAHRLLEGLAHDPVPVDGGLFVDVETDLRWAAGANAQEHTVYFGTDAQMVTDATDGAAAAQATFDPGPLEPGTTYYWRLDTFDGSETRKGTVWSFTTTPAGEGGLQAEYFSGVDDLSGEPTIVRVDRQIDFNWDAQPPDPAVDRTLFSARWKGQIEIPADDTYTFILRSNDGSRLHIDDKLVIEDWGQHAPRDAEGTVELKAGSHAVIVEYMQSGNKASAELLWSSALIARQVIPSVALSPAVRARLISPAVGATDVSQDPRLRWEAAQPGIAHDVYLGTDAVAVEQADPSTSDVYVGSVAQTSVLMEGLAAGTTYYWRIDETDADGSVKGTPWSFTTASFLVVDDMESYTAQAGEEVFTAWASGFGGNGTGSTVGRLEAPFVETEIVNGGNQSLPMTFDNDGAFTNMHGTVVNATHSEIARTFEPARDWSQLDGEDLVVLSVAWRGSAANPAEPLYAAIEDDAGNVAVATHPNAEATQTTEWNDWWIYLAELAAQGIDLGNITKLTIGVGDPATTGGVGTLFIDDIRLYDQTTLPALIEIAPAESFLATGDGGTLLSVNGINAGRMILGTTTFPNPPQYRNYPPRFADDFNLSSASAAEGQPYMTIMYAEPVTTIFIAENGGNDSGYAQALDANGEPMGGKVAWGPASFLTTGYEFLSQPGAALVITAKEPIYGVMFLPPDAGTLGIDVMSAPALPLVPLPLPTIIEIGPAAGFEATGDGGTVVSIDGISVDDLILGTTTFPNPPKHAHYPPHYADDFDLSTASSGDDQPHVTIMYDRPVTTIFIAENGGNDRGYAQALDAAGNPSGTLVEWGPESYLVTEYKFVGQTGGVMAITATEPIYGVKFLPPDGGTLGIDPISAPAVPAE
jgi:predicted esterase